MRTGTHRSAPARAPDARPTRIVGVTALLVFLLIAATAGSNLQTNAVDKWVTGAAHRLAIDHGWIVRVARAATFLGSTGCLVVVIALASTALWIRRMTADMASVLFWSASSAVIVTVIKTLSGRARPSFTDPLMHAGGYAFPSGHATNSTVVYGTLLLIARSTMRSVSARRGLVAVAVTLVAAIGASRVVLGVHWATDVLAGIALGIALLVLAWSTTLHRSITGARKRPPRWRLR